MVQFCTIKMHIEACAKLSENRCRDVLRLDAMLACAGAYVFSVRSPRKPPAQGTIWPCSNAVFEAKLAQKLQVPCVSFLTPFPFRRI
jgi:hypothetical protein